MTVTVPVVSPPTEISDEEVVRRVVMQQAYVNAYRHLHQYEGPAKVMAEIRTFFVKRPPLHRIRWRTGNPACPALA